jgi:hypothetical protein
MSKSSPYRPYPLELRGTFCEIPLAQSKTRWLEIHHLDCSPDHIDSLKRRGFFDENDELSLAFKLKRMGVSPSSDLFWIYNLQTYVLEDKYLSSQEELTDHASDYREWWFADFDKLIEFVHEEFQTGIECFRKKWETRYPKC